MFNCSTINKYCYVDVLLHPSENPILSSVSVCMPLLYIKQKQTKKSMIQKIKNPNNNIFLFTIY